MKTISLQTKMTAVVSAIIIILMLAMASFTYLYFEKTFTETISDQEFTTVSVMAKEIDNKLLTVHKLIIGSALSVPVGIFSDPNQVQDYLDNEMDLKTIFDNHIFFFAPDGKIIAESPGPSRRGLDFSHRDYIKQTVATGKPYIGTPYFSSQHGHPAIMCTAPIFDEHGRLIAIMAGGLDLMKDNFLGQLAETKIGNTGYLYLYNTDRTIILHPDRRRILQQDVPLGVNKYFDQAIEGFEGTAETVNSRGMRALATFKRISSTNWILVANHPVDEAYAPVTRTLEYFVWATLLGILGVLATIRSAVAYFTVPLSRFTEHVDSFNEKKGTERRFPIETTDEIGALTLAFNKMVEQLDSQKASLQKSQELYRTVVDFSSDVAFWHNPAGELLYISPNCERLTGFTDDEFYKNPCLLQDIVHPEDQILWLSYMKCEIPLFEAKPVEFRIVTKAGDIRWISHVCRPVYNESGEFLGIRGSHSDCTERKLAEDQLRYLSWHDPLTGLYNRHYFEQEMDRYAQEPNSSAGIIVCDVDGLKLINDTLGHSTGDALLVVAAQTLKESFPPDTVIARIGGDEFVVLLPNSSKISIDQSCQKIRANIAKYNVNKPQLLLSISIGSAASGDIPQTVTHLFKEADNNMYREKLHRSQSTRSAIVQTLMKALEARDFVTEGHGDRLQDLVIILAQQLHLSDTCLTDLRLFAQFHDIGKVGIPDYILFKPAALTSEERLVMQKHSEIGHRIAQASPDLAPIADWILKHHEWWDGSGYPLGLKGEEIPLECRILAIADAYDAMTNDRPYRKALAHDTALMELRKCAGKQFDPSLVDAFIIAFNQLLGTTEAAVTREKNRENTV